MTASEANAKAGDAAGGNQPGREPDLHQPEIHESLERYWVANVRIMASLTLVWLLAGLGCGILFADKLNEFMLPGTGYPLGFWFAQQGSIMVFVVLILIYCVFMNRLDNKHHREVEAIKKKGTTSP